MGIERVGINLVGINQEENNSGCIPFLFFLILIVYLSNGIATSTGIILMNKVQYLNKMQELIDDTSKFNLLGTVYKFDNI